MLAGDDHLPCAGFLLIPHNGQELAQLCRNLAELLPVVAQDPCRAARLDAPVNQIEAQNVF